MGVLKTGDAGAKRLELQHGMMNQHSYDRLQKEGLSKGKIVWDIGCVNGLMTAYLARKVGETGHVYALDISEDQLRLAKERVESEGFNNVTFVKEDITCATSLPRESADIIYSRYLLTHVQNPASVVEAMKNLLKPGGVVINQESILGAHQSSYQKDILTDILNARIALSKSRGLDYSVGNRLKSLYEQVGFSKVSSEIIDVFPCAKDLKFLFLMHIDEWKNKAIEAQIATSEQISLWKETIQSAPEDQPFLPVSFVYAIARKT